MRISLDQPTFLTSLTEENPANNQTESGGSQEEFPNFLTSLTNQTKEASSTEVTANDTPISQDEAPVTERDFTMDDVANLLLSMGYLSESEKPQVLDDQTKAANADNPDLLEVSIPSSATTSTPTGNEVLQQSLTMNREQSTQASVQMSAEQAAKQSMTMQADPNQAAKLRAGVLAQSSATHSSTPLPKNINPVRHDLKMKLSEQTAVTKANQIAQADGKYRLLSSELVNDGLKTSEKKSNLTLNSDVLPNFDTLADEKVVSSLQQMGAWLQAKVNATPSLIHGVALRDANQDLDALLSSTAPNGAATPAKAAFEAKIELSQSMSNAELNLTTYHANIKIYPPELGKVTAKMKMDKNIATLEITAENKQVKALIQNHLSSLREQFNQSNIQLNKIEVITVESKEQTETALNDQRDGQAPREGAEEAVREITPEKPKTAKKQSENVVDAYV